MLSGQNTILPTASLAPTEHRAIKPTVIGDEWVEVPVIVGERVGNCRSERPADGSASLLEAVIRARATRALERVLNGSAPAPFPREAL